MVAAQLLLVDLRATAITAASVVAILQTCPLLEELDVGECNKMDVLELARCLEQTPLESLVVGRLQKLEICGTDERASWVGYRQHVGSNYLERFSSDPYKRDSGRAQVTVVPFGRSKILNSRSGLTSLVPPACSRQCGPLKLSSTLSSNR
jgi:hypothetical protein